ncbi:MAG: OmpH family outer membrane protein [Candidatus Cryptobacteroides sp.]|nr:OmpH family outer membrane protein [Bacteroidales bacterium]MDY6157753.1 OmpH family outer membrane protein [Candidatus Cryptobacteroides sp.]
MKKAFILSAAVLAGLSLTLVSCNNSSSQNAADNAQTDEVAAAAGSIVYFNLDTILRDYDMANELRSVVETKVNSINQEVTRRRNKLEKDINAFSDKLNKGLLTQSVAQTQNQKLIEQQQSFENYAAQKQQEILEEQQVMMNQLADAINNYIQEFNAEKKYAMIIATQGDILAAPVVAGDPELDITDTLLEGLNAAYVQEKNSQK